MRVAILAGGPSPEGQGSFLSADAAGQALRELGHETEVVDISVPDFWKRLPDFEAAFIAGHGWYAEDGKLQGLLEVMGLPYTGSGVLASSVGMHKPTFKSLMVAHGIETLPWEPVSRGATAAQISRVTAGIGLPLFAKPASNGESFEAGIVRSDKDLRELLAEEGEYSSDEFIAEPFLTGNTFTVGVLDIDGKIEALPVLEAVSLREFYDSEAKQDPSLHEYRCPAPIPDSLRDRMQELAVRVFTVCGCRGVARVDFMLSEDRPVVLEVNTVPGLTLQGNLAAMAKASGLGYRRVVEIMLQSAFDRPAYCP
ncbi:D-alanine--D-alanine ligase family protein [Streptomyces clavuligerus]|uniref:D-alanine--D-alanine ligase n=1 Tax=Streptomyces clavuligerus TaxID=1901 RepID=E2Q112_STRCL|nr:ATP-grasp domain-containing protein [Streptomyces clavuligerus]ANW18798.1 D-alanine--D-alanine ligase [Streptomyces clavuligerus]AXU13368.1 ATP-grasp domain-containing protein [Streptomyces clavuligerus]EFG08517.1 D-alanine--D-alanine ligase [Streptomyces clavuligerus]MBY6303324.1 ATP-grasp domain-containing protein [Streptomyces clavuligerus]QCS06151.1 D-alanine--D-alanine ligase [Streptomyces clavuligerus]